MPRQGQQHDEVLLEFGSGYGSKGASRPHLFEDWQALSSEIVTASTADLSAPFADLWPKADAYVQRLNYLVTGPPAMTGPHWTTFRNGSCCGRSPLLISHQLAALPFFESAWRRNFERYGDACNFLQKLASEYSLHLFSGTNCAINAISSNLYLWIARLPLDCFGSKKVLSCRYRRDVWNGLELATALSQHYSQRPGSREVLGASFNIAM